MISHQSSTLGTSISGFGRALLLGMEALGLNGKDIYFDCGLDPYELGKTYVRYPTSRMQYVWQIAEESVDDKRLLIESTVKHLNASSFYALGFGLYSSSSIEELFDRFSKYHEVIGSSAHMSTQKKDNALVYTLKDLRPVKSKVTFEVLIIFILRICRELYGSNFSTLSMELMGEEREYSGLLVNYVNDSLTYGAEDFRIYISLQDAELVLPSGNRQLASYQDNLCQQYINSLDEHLHFSHRIKLKIFQTITSQDFSIDCVASNLNVSVRTLQRKLSMENASFRNILEEARRELAVEYSKRPALSATQISYMLGYSDLPSFSASFKNWFGVSFTDYRSRNKVH